MEQNAPEAAVGSQQGPEEKTLPWTALWSILAVVATGYLTGWLTGLSESPVAGILLPLLFTLIAGAGGFHVSTVGGGKASARVAGGHVARATVFFMIACWYGVHVGIVTRTSSEAAANYVWSPTQVSDLSAEGIVRLSGIEKKLTLLGLKADALRNFETEYVKEYAIQAAYVSATKGPSVSNIDELLAAIQAAVGELSKARPAVSVAPSQGMAGAHQFQEKMPGYIYDLQMLRKVATAKGNHVPSQYYRDLLEDIRYANNNILKQHEGNEKGTVLTKGPSMDYIPFYALQMVIETQQGPLEDGEEQVSDGITDEDMTLLDTAISLSQGEAAKVVAPEAEARRYSVKH